MVGFYELKPCLQVTHMPPELLRDGQLSKAVDVYAFGVLLWEMCEFITHAPLPVLDSLTEGSTTQIDAVRPRCHAVLPRRQPRLPAASHRDYKALSPAVSLRRYVGERPWAGMRPVTIILKKTQVPRPDASAKYQPTALLHTIWAETPCPGTSI
jgi:ElaB/YqjD/DUF883 family membrane-anchored ribosome-binding protein